MKGKSHPGRLLGWGKGLSHRWMRWALTPILLAACTAPDGLPPAALHALLDQWTQDADLEILRAWPGEPPPSLAPGSPPLEVWCVEVQTTEGRAGAAPSGPIIWIVTRQGREAPWQAAWLLTMSSIWPYEACGGDF